MNRRNIQGVNFIRVRGTEVERARAHAALLKEQVQNGAIPFLSHKNEMIIGRAPGVLSWKPVQAAVIWIYRNVLIPHLHRRNSQEVRDVMKAMCAETGIPYDEYLRGMLQPDAFMLLCRTSVMKYLLKDLPVGALPGCTSGVVLKDWTASGRLLACRNMDYPVVGPWEKNTTVAFQEPTESGHIPHVVITTAGIPSGGLTSMNREGLTLSLHAHFGKKVSFSGTPIIELGQNIIRTAKSIDEAIDLARKTRRYCNWTFVISSAKENDAVALEMTPDQVHVRHAQDGFLAHSNFFHTPELQAQEALVSGGFVEDVSSRLCRMREVLTAARGHLEPKHMSAALGDHIDSLTGEERVFGNTLSVVTTVKSAVLDPGAQRFWISSRQETPVGLGDFLEVDVEKFWQTQFDESSASAQKAWPTIPGNRPKDPALVESVRHYRDAYRAFHMESDRPDYLERTLEPLRKAAQAYPADGNLWMQAAFLAFRLNHFQEARQYLEKAQNLKLSVHTSGVRDLYLARCLDLAGERAAALELYTRGQSSMDPALRKAMRRGLKRPYRASETGTIMLDLQLADTVQY